MNTSADYLINRNIHGFSLGNELILYDELTKQLLRNNPTAAVIWQGLNAGFSRQEIISIISKKTKVAVDQITHDMNNAISQWQSIGLLGSDRQPTARHSKTGTTKQPLDIIDYSKFVPQLPSDSPEFRFRILDTNFRLIVPTMNELRLVTPMLKHLSMTDETKYCAKLSIVHFDGRYLLLHDKKCVDWCADIFGISPMLHGSAVVIAYERAHSLIGVHAAAVTYRGKCILIPAPSGSGKSTLTAALLGSGFSHCADDLVLLTAAPIYMRPVPVAIGLKAGSWKILASYHPNIALLPTHSRSDGKQVRFLIPAPDKIVPMESQSLPIDYIVFPQFLNGGNGSVLNEISSAEGLCRLAEAGYEIQGEMTAENVKQLVDWIATIPCYGLRFSQLNDAVLKIKSLVA